MTSDTKIRVGMGLTGLVLFGGAMYLKFRKDDGARPALVEAPPVQTPPVQTPPAQRPSDQPAAASSAATSRRTHIPRPTRDQPGTRAAPTPPDPEPQEEERGGVDPDLPLTMQALSDVADKMRPSIAACVHDWTSVDPDIAGAVMLAFQLGPEGVQDAWVAEHEEVPVAVLGCFSAAVYEQDWPAAPDGVEITLPFEIEAEAGLAEPEPDAQMVDRR